MKTKKKLKICISISRAPSLFGTYFHNNLYKKYKINAFYKALKIKTDQLKTVFDIVKENDDGELMIYKTIENLEEFITSFNSSIRVISTYKIDFN